MPKAKAKNKGSAKYKAEGREAKNKARNIATDKHRKEKDATKFARRAAERGIPEDLLRHPPKPYNPLWQQVYLSEHKEAI